MVRSKTPLGARPSRRSESGYQGAEPTLAINLGVQKALKTRDLGSVKLATPVKKVR